MPQTAILGQLTYHGYTFNNRTRTLSLQVRGVPDPAGRVTAYCRWELEVRTYITSTSTTDPEVRRAVDALTHRGGVLVFTGRGLGNPNVNTGGVKDLAWGPEPGPVRLEMNGAGNACKLTWSVAFVLPCCSTSAYFGKLMSLSYTVQHERDDAGYLTRTITGFYEIPMTRVSEGDDAIPDSADEYRLQVTPPLIRGFHRKYGPWITSADRRREDFTIIDEEKAGDPLPKNVVDADWTETYSSTSAGLNRWSGTINARYRMRKGATGLDAALAFFQSLDNTIPFQNQQLKALKQGGEIVFVGFNVASGNRHGKPEASFTLNYTFVCELKALLQGTGAFESVGDDTWVQWANSLRSGPFDPYGTLKMRFRASDERLVGLCEATTVDMRGGTAPVDLTRPAAPAQLTTAELRNLYEKVNKPPQPATSWIHYQNELWVELDSGVVPARPLPTKKLTDQDDILGAASDLAGGVVDALGLRAMPIPPGGVGIPGGRLENIQVNGSTRRVKAQCYVYLRGYALRAQYPIDPPRLLDVNDVEAVPALRLDKGEGFGKGVFASGGAVPVHYARWNLRYYLDGLPAKPLPTPPNPLMGVKAT